MDIKKYKKIYMSGIGGISMSGIAMILNNWGFEVCGSDAIESQQTDLLEENGIKVIIGQKADNLNGDIDLYVYSAAIKENNPEFVKAKELGLKMIERGEFLGELTKLFKDTIGVSGTHGKTTTSSMLCCEFLEAKKDPTIQIGSNLKQINGNYRVGNSDYFIIEACEYSNSFLNFRQRSAIVLNIDDDHLDFFGNIENVKKSFIEYVSKLPENGFLVLNKDDERVFDLRNYTKTKVITVGKMDADWTYNNIEFDDNGYPSYDVYHNGNLCHRIKLSVEGEHNVFNSLCSIAMSDAYGIDIDTCAKALKDYTGAQRRMEYKGNFNGARVFDDYGHHPTEINAVLNAIKNKKHNKSWVVFEPHTYSRLVQHLNEFANVLSNFDYIIIIDIYAAREINTYNISEKDLVNLITKLNKNVVHISHYDEIVNYLQKNVQKDDIVLTLGAGYVTKISDLLVNKKDE